MPSLIFLTGAVGVGKTTVASLLAERGFHALAFADPVKEIVKIAFNLEHQWLTDAYKNEQHPFWHMTPREMYQRVGTEAFQTAFGSDIWINNVQLRLRDLRIQKPDLDVVVTDVRPGKGGVQLEAAFARRHGTLVHVIGPSRREQTVQQLQHSSNGPVPFETGDIYLYNTGTVLELRQRVDELVEKLHA